MVGKKQFDEHDALARATDVFRAKGYIACSVDDLTQATGLSRSSLYGTFGNKEQLFLTVLERYCGEMMARLKPDLEAPPAMALERFLFDLLDALEAWGKHSNCLVTTTCSEFANTPPAVQARCTEGLREQGEQLLAYFRAARDRGELSAAADVEHLASYFVAVRQSVGLLWRSGASKDTVARIISTSVGVLEPE